MVRARREAGNQSVGFASRPFVLCGLPIKRPRPGVLLHERRNGHFLLQVTGHPRYGLPWGQDRLVPIFLATLAVRQQSQTITFDSAAEMLSTFDMDQGGSQSRRLVAAFQRVFGATIFFGTDVQRDLPPSRPPRGGLPDRARPARRARCSSHRRNPGLEKAEPRFRRPCHNQFHRGGAAVRRRWSRAGQRAVCQPQFLRLARRASLHWAASFWRARWRTPPRLSSFSDVYWRRHFNADPHLLDRMLHVAGVASTIVGVMPPEFGSY